MVTDDRDDFFVSLFLLWKCQEFLLGLTNYLLIIIIELSTFFCKTLFRYFVTFGLYKIIKYNTNYYWYRRKRLVSACNIPLMGVGRILHVGDGEHKLKLADLVRIGGYYICTSCICYFVRDYEFYRTSSFNLPIIKC